MKILSVYQACTKGPDGKLPECDYFGEGVPAEVMRLFEAAPDLLAALQKCEEQLSIDYPGASREKYWPTIAPILEEARAAIKKALGG